MFEREDPNLVSLGKGHDVDTTDQRMLAATSMRSQNGASSTTTFSAIHSTFQKVEQILWLLGVEGC
jgi:hypothetical protein